MIYKISYDDILYTKENTANILQLRITFKNCESLNCNIYKVVPQLYANKNKIKSFFSEKSPHIIYEISYIKYHTIHIVLQLKIFILFIF